MDKRSTTIIVGVIAVAAAFMLFIFLRSSFIGNDGQSPIEQAPSIAEERTMQTITAKHAFREGVHTVVGEYALPTPCHILETTATVAPDRKTTVIDLVVSMRGDEMCAAVNTPARYRVQFTAPEGTEISARLNGEPVILNLIEAGPNEDLENIELYIKG